MHLTEPSKIQVVNVKKKSTYTPIDLSLLNQVSKIAVDSTRKRKNFNFHQLEDPVQRFLNAIEPGSYIQPHRHKEPLRDEAFIILRCKGMDKGFAPWAPKENVPDAVPFLKNLEKIAFSQL